MLRFAALLLLVLTPVSMAVAQLAQDIPVTRAEGSDESARDATRSERRAVWASKEEAKPSLHYVVARQATMYRAADSTRPYISLAFREPVYIVGKDRHWSEVRTAGGARGYVLSRHLSNTWIRISKSQKTVYVYRGAELAAEIPADLGYNTFADKERRGSKQDRDHWRTPEGTFFVVSKNPRSQYYKAFVLNYPNAEDAENGLKKNLISQKEYSAIVKADREGTMPPMNTALGGMIEIHGHGTGARTNWTQGCVAVADDVMDRLWHVVEVGTPVLIEP